MSIYLGLGSNVGRRRDNLRRGIELLTAKDVRVSRISPVIESPALLPDGAPADWNRPFLNLAVECDVDSTPEEMRDLIANIQTTMGRTEASHWAPRPMDIDILLWNQETISTETLAIPHRGLHERGFVLTPLVALQPRLTIPGRGNKTMLEWSRELSHHIPLWMGIINITPDSFSDGGRFRDWAQIEPHIEEMVRAGVNILDLGAESTRPGADPLANSEEWSRLEPVLGRLLDKYRDDPLRPLISVDTYHPEIAERALNLGADIINDVSGLTSPGMLELARAGNADWIAMHQLGLPASPDRRLPLECEPAVEVERWLLDQLEAWDRAGLDLNRIIFDPGIGFGKDALQSLELLRDVGRFRRHGLRLLVGHSRKSFMKTFSSLEQTDKDLVTVGASMSLCAQGVDIIRVHDIPAHLAAYRGWSHLVR